MKFIAKLAAGAALLAAFGAFLTPAGLHAQDCTPKTFPGAWKGEVTLCQN